MRFFSHPKAKLAAAVYFLISAAAAAAGFSIGPAAGFLTLIVCAVFIAAAAVFSLIRRRDMARLSGEIDRILHGHESYQFSCFTEGELSILESEISKMTVRLREQADSLKKDKLFLADSLADISHQLKTPLTSINLALSMLSDPELSPERRSALLRDVRRSSDRISWLVSALLKLSQLDADTVRFKPERIEASALIRRALQPLEIPLELHDIGIVTNITEGAGLVCDAAWTTEAVGNVLKNCLEHTPDGGTITITAAEDPVRSEITVSDTGPGIAPEDLPHLFERFYRGSGASEQSVGIGLALSRTIMARQNGTIKAENIPGGGARFVLKFYPGTI